MTLIFDLCSAIVSLNTALGLDQRGQLLPGAPSEAIDSGESRLPFALPASLREMYR